MLLALGLLAGSLVAAVSAGTNAGRCGADPACFGVVRMFSFRVGLVAGVAAVVMALTMMGLHRMALLDEARRAARAGPSPPSSAASSSRAARGSSPRSLPGR